jgi:hypothetical protein
MENREYLKNNMKNVFFKLNLSHHDKITKLTNDEIENYLVEIYKTDLSSFLNQYEIFYNSYNVSFMIDNSNNYYLKVQIITPGLNDLLTNKNYQCIYPNCYEMILNIKGSFCPSHTEITQQLNSLQYDKLLKNHAADLKKIYDTFTSQNNLYNYFINFKGINITDFIKNNSTENSHDIQCSLEVIKKTDNMIDIDIPLDFHENLYFKFINNTLLNHNHHMSDSDDESSFNDTNDNLDDLDLSNVDINSLYDDSDNQSIDDSKTEEQKQENINVIEDNDEGEEDKDKDKNEDENEDENEEDDEDENEDEDDENKEDDEDDENDENEDDENEDDENEDDENEDSDSIFSDSDSGSEIDYKLNKDDVNNFLEALKIMKNIKPSECI